MNLILPLALTICLTAAATAEQLFQDGFESGLTWTVTKTNDGRARMTGDHGPAAGAAHLVLDDSTDDAVFSVVETSIDLDLTDKRNVTLAFMAKSLGNEPHAPPTGNFTTTRNYDGVAISCDGGFTWRNVQSLATVGPDWTTFSVPLDSSVTALGGSYGPGFRIRFSAYDNSSAPLDGIAIDSVSVTGDVDPRITVELPGTVAEGSGPHTGYVSLNIARPTPVTVALSSGSTALTLPASVTIPAGDLWAEFSFSAVEDSVVTLSRSIAVNASAAGFSITPGSVVVTDNETSTATLTIPPTLNEAGTPTNNATLGLTPAPSVPITFTLAADPAAELTLPATVTLPAGQTQVAFTARATNDTKIDGDIPVSVSAYAPGLPILNTLTTAVDNENRALTLTLPSGVAEGGTGTGTVAISGTLPDALPVNLEIVRDGTVLIPVSIFIPAGATQATFSISAANNDAVEGSKTLTLTATAPGFTSSAKPLVVGDNDPAGYTLSALTDLVPTGSPQNLTVTARDLAGTLIYGSGVTVNLDLLLPDGGTLPVSPATITLTGNNWTGAITLPDTTASGLRLRVRDAGGRTALSTTFDPIRSLALTTADLAWNPLRGVLYASVPSTAGGTYAGCVVEIDPATLEIRRSVYTTQNPGQLALTSGGEYLYAAQEGNARVVKIDPATMGVVSSFAVGVDYGTLYADDICTVAGKPDLLLVSQRVSSGSPSNKGVVAYDNGVPLAVRTQEHTNPVRIEPSADPTKFWCYTGSGFHRLKLDATGISVAETTSSLGGTISEVRALGDRIFVTNGDVIDGTAMVKKGKFPTSGPLWPDAVLNRTYFLEQSSSNYNRIGSYDSTTLAMIRQMSMPSVGSVAGSVLRWGDHGLAFRSATNVHLVSSASLVPDSPPADLAVTVATPSTPVLEGQTFTYTVRVKNLGPNPARGVVLSTTLSTGQTLQTATASVGDTVVNGSLVTWLPPDLENAATATLTLTVQAGSAGGVNCTTKAVSNVVDPDFSNNLAGGLVSIGYLTATDSVNAIRLGASSLLYDPTRNLLWATLSSTLEPPFRNAVVSINPLTGSISEPIPLGIAPYAGAIALSGNGRYLYAGLQGTTSFARIDLSQSAPVPVRIPFTTSSTGQSIRDIEVLDGDGTSVLLATTDQSLLVIDGETQRPVVTSSSRAADVERTAVPGVFFGHCDSTTAYESSLVQVTATGVEVVRARYFMFGSSSGSVHQLSSAGNRVLTDGGHLADAADMSLIATLPVYGAECLDAASKTAYIVNGTALHTFDSDTGQAKGSLPLPAAPAGDWALACVRWGIDGIAILGSDGRVHVGRWSGVIPVEQDVNADGISDSWAAAHFGTIQVNPGADSDGDGLADALEYLFATSPTLPGTSPLRQSLETQGGNRTIILRFPRRAGIAPASYRIEVSDDIRTWLAAPGVTETVLSTGIETGTQVEQVEARIPMARPDRGYARIKWLHH